MEKVLCNVHLNGPLVMKYQCAKHYDLLLHNYINIILKHNYVDVLVYSFIVQNFVVALL